MSDVKFVNKNDFHRWIFAMKSFLFWWVGNTEKFKRNNRRRIKTPYRSKTGTVFFDSFERDNCHTAFAFPERSEPERLDKFAFSKVVLNAAAQNTRAFAMNDADFG